MIPVDRWFALPACFLWLTSNAFAQWEASRPSDYRFESRELDMCFDLKLPSFELGKRVLISFSVYPLSGRGPAPDGMLSGIPLEGFWTVQFRDSFGNSGEGKILLKEGSLVLQLRPRVVEDPRAARYYGEFELTALEPGSGAGVDP